MVLMVCVCLCIRASLYGMDKYAHYVLHVYMYVYTYICMRITVLHAYIDILYVHMHMHICILYIPITYLMITMYVYMYIWMYARRLGYVCEVITAFQGDATNTSVWQKHKVHNCAIQSALIYI